MFNFESLESVRGEMVSEIENDISQGKLYISDRLTVEGKETYPVLLIEAAKSLKIDKFISSVNMNLFNSHYQRKKPKGGYSQVKMPINANSSLCEGEFNRFYIRAVCIKAIELGEQTITVYRARHSDHPRPESIAIDGTEVNPEALLDDLRKNIGTDSALGLPPGPNSGMSVKLKSA